MAPEPVLDFDEPTQWSIAWFPRTQRDAALARWPNLVDDLGDPDGYCQGIERTLRQVADAVGRRPVLAPLDVEQLVAYANSEGIDPSEGSTRSRYAAELARTGNAMAWPPGRNDACWCGSGRKYKRCCAAA
jgi:hypothetical protein